LSEKREGPRVRVGARYRMALVDLLLTPLSCGYESSVIINTDVL
jgi:hypothetical protein